MSEFQFKYFTVQQTNAPMKVGTDAMLLGTLIDVESKTRILDIGTGTGVISLMLAQRTNDDSTITAVEIDELAADECQLNFENSPWKNRLELIQEDFLNYSSEDQYDLIVSNPPYFQTTRVNDDERKAKARHGFSLPIHDFFKRVNQLLTESGNVWIIIPFIDEDKWIESALEHQLHLCKHIMIQGKEKGEIKRVICHFSPFKKDVVKEVMAIRTDEGRYTASYKALTSEFHSVVLR